MLALIIILAVIVLLLLMPVGVDMSFIGGAFSLSVKAGPLKIKLLPAKPKAKAEKKQKARKKEKKKPAKEKQKLTLQDIMEVAKLGLKALSRFRRALSIDKLMLHLCVATEDPYDTVVRYGYINAALGGLLPYLHRAFKIRDEDIGTAMSFEEQKTSVDARFAATLQIWEILYIGICTGIGFLAWLHRRKKRKKESDKNDLEKGS